MLRKKELLPLRQKLRVRWVCLQQADPMQNVGRWGPLVNPRTVLLFFNLEASPPPQAPSTADSVNISRAATVC